MRLSGLFVPSLLLVTLLQIPISAAPDAAPTLETTNSPALGTVTAATLSNGLRVVIAPSQSSDLVTLDAWVGAGTRRETAANNGVAHFMEHLLFKGTPTRKPGEIDADIEDLGGTLNAATSYDWAHFYVTVGSSDADAALSILSDALMNAQLRQEDIDNERPVILNEMARELSSPTNRLTRVLNALTYPTHPYGRPLLGTLETVSQIQHQTVTDFYHTYYAPSNVTLVLTGHISADAGVALARKYLGAWPNHLVPSDQTLPDSEQTDIRVRRLDGLSSQAYVMMGFAAPSVHDGADPYVMDIILTLLGQGGNNRLEADLQRKRKLVTAISANYLTQRDPGTMTITATCVPGDIPRVRDAILAEVGALRDAPISDTELAAAKHSLLASYLFDAQSTRGRADALGFYSIIDTYRYDTDYIPHFESVTPAQVQSVAQKYFTPSAYTFVTMSPATAPATALQPFPAHAQTETASAH